MGIKEEIGKAFALSRVTDVFGGRKFIGLVIATWLCYGAKINGWVWLIAFVIYCFFDVLGDILKKNANDFVIIAKKALGIDVKAGAV